MRLGDLVGRGDLGLSVVAAREAGLTQGVLRPYVTDLPDPGRFLRPGDLVLTSCLWYRDAGDSARFVDSLVDSGVVGLVAGLLVTRSMPDGLVAACTRRGLPLLTLGNEFSFGPICETVMAGKLRVDAARSATFQRRLVDAVGRGGGAQGALDVFRGEFGVDCWMVTPAGGLLAAAGPAPSAAEIAVATTGKGDSVWPVYHSDHRVGGYLVCAAGEAGEAVRTLVSVLGLERELGSRERSAEQRHVADLVSVLGTDAAPGEVSAHLRMLGADPRLSTVVIAATLAGDGQTTLEMLAEVLSAPGRRLLGCVHGGQAVILVNGEVKSDALAQEIEAATHRYGPLLRQGRLLAGLSEPTASVSDLAAALDMARQRLRSADGRTGAVVTVHGFHVDSHAVLLSAVPHRLRRSFRQQLLRPLAKYDALHGSDLVKTLTVFLESCGSWQRSAEELHVHVNTLRYRIQRIEQLTGRSLNTMRDRVDLYLALTCLEAE